MMNYTQRCVDELGRIVLPREMRERFGWKERDKVEIIVTDEGILLRSPKMSSCDKMPTLQKQCTAVSQCKNVLPTAK